MVAHTRTYPCFLCFFFFQMLTLYCIRRAITNINNPVCHLSTNRLEEILLKHGIRLIKTSHYSVARVPLGIAAMFMNYTHGTS